MLRPHGYRNYMVGKWHVTPLTESGATGPFDGWPLGRGFDRFYGFLDAETDQYAPELVRDNTPIDPPGTYAGGYHLTSDLVDQAIRFIADHAADRPDMPWLTWLAFGACHAPHQAPARHHQALRQGIRRMAGTSSASGGWRARRRWAWCRPTPGCRARNDGVKAWDEHSADEKRVFTRLQAAFAGMLDHADRHLARLVGFLERPDCRQHADPGDVGQWRQPGGRSARLCQRHGPLQSPPRADRGKAARGSTTSAGPTRTPIFRMAGRWRRTRRCAATSRTPMAAASAIRS